MEDAKDLVVLAADKQIAETLRGVLSRPQALAIRPVSFSIYPHPRKDPGCLHEAEDFLRSFQRDAHHALVLFDYHGCGASNEGSPDQIEERVEERLGRSGWDERARCIVIDPELEVWVWSDSPEVDECLGWGGSTSRVRDWLRENGQWPVDAAKPPDPKEAVEMALEEVRQPRSSSLFRNLAESVSLSRCEDDSFQRFRQTVQEWFSPSWE